MTEDEIVEAMTEAYYAPGSFGPLDGMRKSLRIALPWAREQALREAARVAKSNPFTGSWAEKTILALIPARPTQETTDG